MILTYSCICHIHISKRIERGFTAFDAAVERTHVAKVARPVLCTFGAQAEIDANFEIFGAEDLLGAYLIDLFWFAIDEKKQDGGSISRNERYAHAGGIERYR